MHAKRLEFTVAAVAGVTLTKWTRAWNEWRSDRPLTVLRVEPAEQSSIVKDGTADVAFVRLPVDDETLSVIPLYEEQPVVVAPKGHVFEAVEQIVVADLDAENRLDDTLRDSGWEAAIRLVAANVGVVVVPQSIARLFARTDVISRPVTDATTTRIALAWVTASTSDDIDDFIGIVRGRTANSSRSVATPPAPKPVRSPSPKGFEAQKQTPQRKTPQRKSPQRQTPRRRRPGR